MKRAFLVAALAAISSSAWAERRLTLAEAVEVAIAQDPLVTETHVQEDRAKLGVLRAQLDRFSLKIDAQLTEFWNQQNILGPTVPPQCSVSLAPDEATCNSIGKFFNNPGVAWNPNPDQSPSAGLGNFSFTANLAVPVFTGFRITSSVKRSQLQRDAAIVAVKQQRHDTALAVGRAYWTVRRFELVAGVAAQALDRMREAEAVTDGRVRAGLAPPIDFNRAHLRRVQQEAVVADLRGQADEARAQLAVALGINDSIVLSDEVTAPETAPPPVEQILSDAQHGRAEPRLAALQLQSQEQTLRIARSTYYPQLNGVGLFQYGNNPLIPVLGARVSESSAANPFNNLSGNLTLGATLSINLFDTMSTWSTTRDAHFEEARLQAEQRRAVRLVETDVRLAHAKILHLLSRRGPLLAAREIAADNAGILEARYKNGDALVLELLDAQNDRTTIEQTLADVSAQLQIAWIELDAALGKTVGVER
jgi:outer membrane protein TolC